MPFRLIPILLVAALVLMFAIGAFDDRSNAGDAFNVDGVLTEVDAVLDDALHESSFDWLSGSLTGAADTVEGGVENIPN